MSYSRQPVLAYSPTPEEIETWDQIITDAQADWGAPWGTDDQPVVVTVRVSAAVHERLQAMCWELRLSKAELVRAMAMDAILKKTRSESFIPAFQGEDKQQEGK